MSLRRQEGGVRGGLFGPPRLTLLFGAGLILLYGLFGPAPESLLFDRERILAGEWWRGVTGHLVHADPAHLLWNVAALSGLGLVYELLLRPRPAGYFGLIFAGMLAVDAWLLWLEPDWTRYCGLSGALNALYAGLALAVWRETRSPIALLLVAGGLLKIAFEAVQGGALLPTSTWASVPGAHLAGLAAGLALGCRRGIEAGPRTLRSAIAAGNARTTEQEG